MKLNQMKAIAETRENLIGFLHHSEITAINHCLVNFDADKKSFYEICNTALKQYQDKAISNRNASRVFEILAS